MEKTSRFNYIKKGIVGVCAATMLTGLCAGAAFGTDIKDGATTGTSSVKVTSNIQISATVPTTIGMSITNDGITVPDSSVLKIQNLTKNYGITVTNVQASIVGTGFTLSSDGQSLANNQLALAVDKTGGSAPVYVDTTKKDLDWGIAASSDGTTAQDLTFSLTPTSGTLTKDFFGNYTAVGGTEALTIEWTVGLS